MTARGGPALQQTAATLALVAEEVSLKRAAWAYGCAKKGSDEERLLLELLVNKAREELTRRGAL